MNKAEVKEFLNAKLEEFLESLTDYSEYSDFIDGATRFRDFLLKFLES